MKGLFLDTNILIDFLADRQPFAAPAAYLFELGEQGKTSLYVSSLSFPNIYYIVRKQLGHKASLKLLAELASMTVTLAVDGRIMSSALASGFHDFEDALQYYTAISTRKVEAIVTRDTKGYRLSSIPVFTPDEALAAISLGNE